MFRVEWHSPAVNELTDLWLQANSTRRAEITAATHELDQRLRKDPENEGESRSADRRVAFIGPLGVLFRVDVAASIIEVVHVWSWS